MDDIIAGIVTYNPDCDRLFDNICLCLEQIDRIIIVDNGSNNLLNIKNIIDKFDEKIEFYPLGSNKGIAFALNELIRISKDYKKDWLLTLDQDSILVPNILNSYTSIHIDNAIAMITSIINDRNFGVDSNFAKEKEYESIEACITSGCLLNVDKAIEVDGFDDTMFIDYVDFDLCKRLILKGYKIVRINQIGLIHEVGNGKIVRKFGKKVIIYNHNRNRHFYQARNRAYFMRKYGKYLSIKDKLKFIKLHIEKMTNILLFENDKFRKTMKYIEGLIGGYAQFTMERTIDIALDL